MIMKRILNYILLGIFLTAAGCAPYWVRQAEKVKPGMTRPEVEKYLPLYNMSPTFVSAEGDTVVYSYWVDPRWKVTIFYNFNGMPVTDTYGIDWSKSDSVQVIGLPEVEKEKMMTIKPLTL